MPTRFNMIGIFVNDLHTMVAFYRDVLGLNIEWNGEGPYAEFKHAGIRISMYDRALLKGLLGQEVTFPQGINGTFELSIDFPEYRDVDHEFDRLLKLGARPVYKPRNESWGMRSAMILDPENNLIEIGSWNKSQ